MHPLFEKAWKEALETGDFSKIPDVRMRAYNEYFTANPNKLGREYQNEDGTWEYRTDAEDFNVTVDKKYENNQIVINEQGLLIDRIIKSEAGIIPEDSPNYLTRENAREQMNAFEELAPKQENNLSASKTKGSGLKVVGNEDPNLNTQEKIIIHTAQTDQAVKKSNDINLETGEKEKKSATVADGDGTTFTDKSIIRVKLPTGLTLKLNPTEFAEQSKELEEQGAELNFDDFINLFYVWFSEKNTFATKTGFFESSEYNIYNTGLAFDYFTVNSESDINTILNDVRFPVLNYVAKINGLRVDPNNPARLISI